MAEYIHNLDPFIFQISGQFGIRWYGMAYLFGFLSCMWFTHWLAKKGKSQVSAEQAGDFIVYLALGTMIGGRLGYVLFYSPELLTTFSDISIFGINIPMWNALAVWQGGMASHGGIIGLFTACVLFGRKHKIDFFHLLDIVAICGSLAIFFGRIANFINGELYGRACAGKCFWPVKFPDELRRWVSTGQYDDKLRELHSVVEAMGPTNIGGQIQTVDVYQWKEWVNEGTMQLSSMVSQILTRVANGDVQLLQKLGEVLIARHPSQLYQAVLEGLCLFLITFWMLRKPIKPGVIASFWGMGYAIMRIIGEQWRMPDAQIGYQLFGLTRGQWLSIAMFVVFAFIAYRVNKRDVPKLGGWAT